MPNRDLVLAAFSSMIGLAAILLALMGFIFVRYDTLRADTTIDPERLRPFQLTLIALVCLIAVSAVAAALAMLWLLPLGTFDYPLWLVGVLIVAIPAVGIAVLRLRW